MKLSKLFKIGLPLLGVVAVSTTLPLALTSCNSNSSSSDNTTSESLILEPIDMSTVQLPEHNFQNSFQQAPTTISSLAEANKQLQQQWDSLSDEQKGQALKNDLENWALTFSQTDPYYSTWQKVDQITNDIINRVILLSNDPHGKFNLIDTYNWRFFERANIDSFSYKNGKLNLGLSWNRIFQLSKDGKVVSQLNYRIICNFNNVYVTPICLQISEYNNKLEGSWMSSLAFKKYDYSYKSKVTNIISDNSTPINDYFEKNVNIKKTVPNNRQDIDHHQSFKTTIDMSPFFEQNINAIDDYLYPTLPNGNFIGYMGYDSGYSVFLDSIGVDPNAVGQVKYFYGYSFASPTLSKLYKIQPIIK